MAHNVLCLRFQRDESKFDDYVGVAKYCDYMNEQSENKFSPFKFKATIQTQAKSYFDVVLATESIYRFKFSFLVLPCIFMFSYWFLIPYLLVAMCDLTQSRFGLYGLFWLGMRKRGLHLSPKIVSTNEIVFKYV